MACLLMVAATVCMAGELSTSFEEGAAPPGWRMTDGGISTLSDLQARTGTHSLRIVDPDNKAGSEVRSESLPVATGDLCSVSLWVRLESGNADGLGVYLEYVDADGKRLAQASEASAHKSAMVQDQWVQMSFTTAVPEGAAKVALRLHSYSSSVVTCFVDDVKLQVIPAAEVGPGAEWSGGTLDEQTRRVWPRGVRWDHSASTSLTRTFAKPQDWSSFGALRFWVHSAAANNSSFMVLVNSENPATEGGDYYGFMVKVDWEGWKELILPFREIGASRQPRGWNQVDSVVLTASGWGQTVNPATVLTLDGFELTTADKAGGQPTDEEFFASLNLDLPELAAIKTAVQAKDMAAARKALADHLRARTYPRWTIDWRNRPLRDVKVPGPEDDKAPDQWDYYSTFLTVDWEGWKHFTLTKADFSPQTLVEGKGWQGKQPIGWHWIQYLAVNAKGWGLTPDPSTVLYFDNIRLVGKDGSQVIADFEGEESNWTGLTLSGEQTHEGKGAGKWADTTQVSGLRCDNLPHDWTNYDALDFWVYSAKATGQRLVMVLDSDVPGDILGAEKALRHEFNYTKGPGESGTITFGDQIDWTANPTEGEARTHLWNESINRHFHFATLAGAYWQTGKDKYAAEIAAQILDWTARMPRPLLSSGNNVGHYAWQTLTTGIRLADTWPNALYRCLDSPSFTPEVLTAMMKAVQQQAQHLIRWPSTGNWLTAESNGLFTAGMLFPEFRDAAQWRRIAVERLYKQLDDEVYPDGMEYELAAGYNTWVVSEFAHILELADLNNLRPEMPADYQAKIEKMFNYVAYAAMPNGAIPGLNDSGNADVRGLLATGLKLFPQRQDFEYVSSLGARGVMPTTTSHAFPWTGHYVMRSGWDKDATFLLFDAGPYGYGHQHEDKLSFVLWAKGSQQVLDPGNFSYDSSRWRRYVLATYGHNTVMVDGQGQRRGSQRSTYFWPRPWQGAGPQDQDARWVSTPEADFASGVYADGYGAKAALKVTHQRGMLFLKDLGVFVVLDTLTPPDDAEHRYEALFHLDSDEAQISEGAVVSTQKPQAANVVILPASALQVEIVKGKTEEPVQGWSNGPWRAIPTAIYSTTGTGVTRMAFVMEPVGVGETRKVKSVKVVPGVTGGTALEIELADGSRRVLVQRDQPGEVKDIAGIATSHEITVALQQPGGALTTQFALDGKIP